MKQNSIVVLATHKEGLTQEEALTKAKEKGLRLLTNLEVDELLNGNEQLWKNYKDAFPCWTGTRLTYGETGQAIIEENGKTHNLSNFPKEDGWYFPDKFGIPSGKESNPENQKARYLWRISSNSSLVARSYFDRLVGDYRRDVYAYGRHDIRFGVLAEKIEADKNVSKKESKSEYQRGYEQGLFDAEAKIKGLLRRR